MNLSDKIEDTNLSILIIDENPIRTAIIEAGLTEASFPNVTVLKEMQGLVQHIYKLDPDVVLIDLENPNRDVLEQMFQVSRIVKRPIAMFVDQSDKASIDAAIEAGVSAYIVDGLKKERVRPILEMTISRFHAFDKLHSELDQAKSELEDRKLIEKAKGILMASKNLTEHEAYALLRRTAMNHSCRIVEIAKSLIQTQGLL